MPNSTESGTEREKLVFGRPIDWKTEGLLGTVFFGPEKQRVFPPLPTGTIREVAKAGYLDLNHSHNEAPTAGELLAWAEWVGDEYYDYQLEIGLIGYMTHADRPDSRIALEGISIRSPGVLPSQLKSKAARDFDPDLLTVDDFHIILRWD